MTETFVKFSKGTHLVLCGRTALVESRFSECITVAHVAIIAPRMVSTIMMRICIAMLLLMLGCGKLYVESVLYDI